MPEEAEIVNSYPHISSFIREFLSNFTSLVNIALDIEYSSDVLRTARAVRHAYGLRKKLTDALILEVLDFLLSRTSALNARISAFLAFQEDDFATYAPPTRARKFCPELELFCYFLVLIFLVERKRYDEAKNCSMDGFARLMDINVVEPVAISARASRMYFYYSYTHEVSGDLAEIRRALSGLHRVAISNHDELGQETLINLLLRNYLHYNLYDQAGKLMSKAPKFQSRSNHQLCRYLFYLGKIRTIRLEYSDAKESFVQASQIAPVAARGFRIQCNKWAVLVRLLLGEVPERTIFTQSGMQGALRPYFELTNVSDFSLSALIHMADCLGLQPSHRLPSALGLLSVLTCTMRLSGPCTSHQTYSLGRRYQQVMENYLNY